MVTVVAGDTSGVSLGLGGFASRQTVTAGSSVHLAAKAVAEKAKKVASHVLEADEDDLELKDGEVRVAGAPQLNVKLGEIARILQGAPGYGFPAGVDPGLEANVNHRTDSLAYANGCHACEVEVDAETGEVKILRYVAMQDFGILINPMMVEGQIHGGVAHGIGNALYEWMGYDDAGQPVTTTFADYLLPTATEVPMLDTLYKETRSPLNPLGVKGVGEAGTIPARGRADLGGRGRAVAVRRAHRPGAAVAVRHHDDDPAGQDGAMIDPTHLRIETMASGHLTLVLRENASWADFEIFAPQFLAAHGGTVVRQGGFAGRARLDRQIRRRPGLARLRRRGGALRDRHE